MRLTLLAFLLSPVLCADTVSVASQIVINNKPFLDQDNGIWDNLKKMIVQWLPGFVEGIPYPNEDIVSGNVHIITYDTYCKDFQIQEQDINLQIIPGFPSIQANIQMVVPYAEYISGLDWRLYHCVWKFTCFGNKDVATAKLYNFQMDINATLDINPLDSNSKTPVIKSAFIQLNDIDLSIKGHWYSQWMYNAIFRLYGKKIDAKVTTALNEYLAKEIGVLVKDDKGDGEEGKSVDLPYPNFFEGELGEELNEVARQYYALQKEQEEEEYAGTDTAMSKQVAEM